MTPPPPPPPSDTSAPDGRGSATGGRSDGARGQGGQSGQGGGSRSGGGSGGNRSGGGQGRAKGGGGSGRSGGGSGGGSGGRSGGGSRQGGRSRPSSGGGRPGGGGNRGGGQGQRRNGRPGGGSGRPSGDRGTSTATTPPAPLVQDQRAAKEDEERAALNRRRAVVLCALPGAVLGLVVGVVVALVVGPLVGVAVLVVLAGVVTWFLWSRAPRSVLRAVGARPSVEYEHPRLYNLVGGLCGTMGLPRPAIAVVDHPLPNAMAVGHDPDSAVIVVTSGLDGSLTLVELEGVLAHELVRIKRGDPVLACAAVSVFGLLAPVLGSGPERVHRTLGAGQAYTADQRAVSMTRYPPGLAGALDVMAAGSPQGGWPPGGTRAAALTRWLWIDPMASDRGSGPVEGNLDDTGVRAAALHEL